MPSGKWFDDEGNNIERPKLVINARKHPDMISATFNGFYSANLYKESVENLKSQFSSEELKGGKKEVMCEVMSKYKYLIIIDGQVSTWARAPQILMSDSVPIVIESRYHPLYLDQWKPFVHYIPVKHDQSDLYDRIAWLQ